jgi:fructuronate reductase
MRLSDATLASLPDGVARPGYDRSKVRTGVVHLGIGAFHRAHQAAVFDAALAAGDLRWAVLGVSLRSAAVRDQLAPQDGLYSLVERDGSGDRVRVIGSVQGVLVAPDNPAAVVAALAAADTHIVTLTITEKGYKLVASRLDEGDPDVAHDLVDVSAPRTAPGFLVAALEVRRRAGLPPFTTLSCDNLSHNGDLLRGAVLAMAERRDAGLAEWIADHAAFPNTMVDRIVPATTDADISSLAWRLGVEDRAMVKAEPYLQWVIEDRFCSLRPDFERLGVQITSNVAAWEEAKLRLLNGAHSAMAYIGGLRGLSFVHEFVSAPEGRSFVEAMWDESETTLSPPTELDVARYRNALMTRFANPALQHRLVQIAADGSQKIPQRLIAPVIARLAAGQPVDALALAIAAWMRWQSGRDHAGRRFTVDDPLSRCTADALEHCFGPSEQVDALLAVREIFPLELASNQRFRTTLAGCLDSVRAKNHVKRSLA